MDLDIDHLRGWIGREEVQTEPLTGALVARFNATFDRSDPCEDGADAPPMIHLCLGQPNSPAAELGPDGHPARGGFLPPVPLPRRMWAGGAFEFHAPLRIGETVRRRSVIEDVVLKEGRSGPLCFVTVIHHVESGGRRALTERQDIVYRMAQATAPASPSPPPAPEGRSRLSVAATPTLLFRYSALTFNGHRIHYDRSYARDEEGYPGLVVHGPMQATMLLQMAQDIRGAPPARFDFRSLSPLFDTHDFTLNADEEADALRLWTARDAGPVAMEARARW
ncbi:MaoC family dehydratase N-terminal domain-containing protein (plasmid) [Limimaricola variabilis]|jgi:3-methylfumaryl-CoA hydratase|uniref:FAS1-like dehydratase domain-containing protein n=1 Tax=Limimaricola variabilis TaxID=1492771 RepID=UPI002AC8D4CD|nr:MaoC family dehydratase N-terminal domain-containing protein [Limimaricola variabilis]WPY96396.1 MaoC family dehydratase N-terminal domain-containing protein [Limimaricola variabilis]